MKIPTLKFKEIEINKVPIKVPDIDFKFKMPKFKFKFKWPPFAKDLAEIILLFLSWRGALFLVAYFGFFSIQATNNNQAIHGLPPLISMWLVWDYGWFKDIAAMGYSFNHHSMAFFPLWPATIWLFSQIFHQVNTHIVAFVVANLITLIDCWVFYKLVLIDYDKDTAYRSVKYFLFFPMSLFLASAYSEPLFLLGVLLTFYFIRQKPTQGWSTSGGKYLLSGVGGIIASGARLVGSVLLLPMFIEIVKDLLARKITRQNWWKVPAILIAPLGLLGYMYYLKNHFGDPLGFMNAYQNSDWQRGFGFDAFNLFWKDIQTLVHFDLFNKNNSYTGALVTTGSVILMTLVLLFNIRKIRFSYFIYAMLIILVPLFSDTLFSINRYVLPVFPFFMALGIQGKRKWVDSLVTVTFIVLLAFFTLLFTNRWWVG